MSETSERSRTRLVTMISLRFLLVLAAPVLLMRPAYADKCTGAKLKAIGKKEAGLLVCSAREATIRLFPEPRCETTVSGKFMAAYNKPTGCMPAAPSASQCELNADNCQSMVRSTLPAGNGGGVPSKCEAARLKAAGTLANSELGCYARAAVNGAPVDTVGCIPKAQMTFMATYNKFAPCAGDSSTETGTQATIEAACVQAQVTTDGSGHVTGICPTSTTSTTMSTTTTTTTTLLSLCSPTAKAFDTCTGNCDGVSGGLCLPLCQDTCPAGQLVCVLPFGFFGNHISCTTDADCANFAPFTLCAAGVSCSACGAMVSNNDCAIPCN